MMSKISLIKFITIILVILIASKGFANATPSDIRWPQYNDDTFSQSAIVMDADSSLILYENNANQKLYPASIVKIMTALIVLDKVNGNYDDLVTFSYNAVTRDIDRQSATIGASAGDQLSVKDCLYSLLLPSANDVANALAEYIAGSINDFVLLMNEKASILGLKNTNFVNPSGLHDDNQYTTAYDMAIIMQHALKYPMFVQISSSVSYRHAPIRKFKDPNNSNNQVLNTNSIMVPGSRYYYNGVTAGKTGHTSLAGYNLAASAKRNNMHLICVILKSQDDKSRFEYAKKLFDFGFNNYQSLTIKSNDKRFINPINTISINDIDLVKTLNITCNDDAHITIPKNESFSNVISNIDYKTKNPYNKYAIGCISYYLYNRLVGSCDIEGRDIELINPIFTGHLDLSKKSETDNNSNPLIKNSLQNANTNALIYKNSNGKIIFSNTLLTSLKLIVFLILFAIISSFIYTKFLTNSKLPINKLLFKIRRFAKKHK